MAPKAKPKKAEKSGKEDKLGKESKTTEPKEEIPVAPKRPETPIIPPRVKMQEEMFARIKEEAKFDPELFQLGSGCA
jgi:hypothetical protein